MQSPTAPNFGRYEILAEIGRGAMGVVYKARDPKIDRTVAIKTIALSEQLSIEEKEFRDRFFLEARAAGRLSHPSIVTVYDVGEDAQNPYIVMEYVEGESLDRSFSQNNGVCDPDYALELVQALAHGLDYAHSQGIVHRDIKPANILLTPGGRPKITDFGVAKLNMAYQTVAGQSLGTPAYMSPEQLNGDPVDGRSDLFSLGVILYTLLTGHRPFQGNSAMTVSFRVVHREPLPVSAYDSDFPPDVDYVIGRAIAKDVASRYQTGKEMAEDLDDLRNGLMPRSKEKHPAEGSVIAAQTANPSSTSTQSRFKRSTRPAPASHPVQHWSMWEWSAVILLVLGVSAITIAVLRPLVSADPGASPAPLSTASRSQRMDTSARTTVSQNGGARQSRPNSAPPGNSSSYSAKPQSQFSTTAPQHAVAMTPDLVHRGTISSASFVPAPPPSTLHIRMEHRFPSAELRLWIDDKLEYKESSDGKVRRRMGLFKAVQGYKSDTLPLASGEHNIRVRVQSSDNAFDRSATIHGVLPPNAERQLTIDCTKGKQIHLALE